MLHTVELQHVLKSFVPVPLLPRCRSIVRQMRRVICPQRPPLPPLRLDFPLFCQQLPCPIIYLQSTLSILILSLLPISPYRYAHHLPLTTMLTLITILPTLGQVAAAAAAAAAGGKHRNPRHYPTQGDRNHPYHRS